MNRYNIIYLFVFFALPVLGQNDSVCGGSLTGVTVTTRIEIYNNGSRTDKPDSLLKPFFMSSSLASLLDASGGLVIRSYGPGVLASSSLRGGSAQQTTITWNGISINSPVHGQYDLNLVPSFLFDEALILPGIAGSLQGSGAISGSINLNNPQKKQKGFSAEVLQTMGSFETYNGGFKIYYLKNKWINTTKAFYSATQNNYPFNNRSEAGNPKENLTNARGKTLSVMHESGYQSKKSGNFKISYWGTFAERQIPPTLLMESSDAAQFDNIHKTMLQWDKQFKKLNFKFSSVVQKDYLKY
ncbi:MAG: TonB-dependent receptor, partial [Bacteroidia bacterium]